MQNQMHGDLVGSKAPTFIFEGPDGLGMNGLLSDSNESSSNGCENGINDLINSSSVGNGHSHVLDSQPFHQVHNNNEKRKLDDVFGSGDNQPAIEPVTKKCPPANGKKTKGRVKIKMEFIDNKLRRYTTFSKRKTGIMKKAYELSTLTGTQVMLLVASETGHVYTFATRKLQPMITSEAGKALIQTCLNSPDPPNGDTDQRMSATGFEETDLTYTVNEEDSSEKMSNGFASVPSLFVDSPADHGLHPGPFSLSLTDAITCNGPQNLSLPPFCFVRGEVPAETVNKASHQ